MDSIISYLLAHAPWVVLILLAIWGTWKVSKYHSSVEDYKKKVDKLPCESHSNSLRDLSDIKNVVSSTNDIVTELSKWVMHTDNSMIDILAPKHSPRTMTPLGRKLFEISKAKSTIDNNRDFFLNEIERTTPKTAFDVEDNALEVLLKNLSNDIFQDVKNYIYNEPEQITLKTDNNDSVKISLSLSIILRLMAIELRDLYLQKHPELVSVSAHEETAKEQNRLK